MTSENDYEKVPLINNSEGSEIPWTEIQKQEFKELGKSPYDLWLIYIIKLFGFDWVAIMFVTVAVYCTDILDLPDTEYGIFAFFCGFGCLFSTFLLANIKLHFAMEYGNRRKS